MKNVFHSNPINSHHSHHRSHYHKIHNNICHQKIYFSIYKNDMVCDFVIFSIFDGCREGVGEKGGLGEVSM